MSTIPKHQPKNGKRPRTKKESAVPQPNTVVLTGPNPHGPTPSIQHDINHITGLADIEESLNWLAKGVNRLTSDDHAVTLSVSQGSNTNPVQVTLSGNNFDDTMDRLVTAFERIADSVARLAGLSRPRLESWHEQDEYTPRYKDVACDGGAPGPRPSQQQEF